MRRVLAKYLLATLLIHVSTSSDDGRLRCPLVVKVDSVRIYWPEGSPQILTNVPVERPVVVEQPGWNRG